MIGRRSPDALGETALVTTAAATLLAIVAWPAFHAYFFGEAFLYLGQYWGAGERFWTALFSPSDFIFFKPVCFAASLPWYFLLPPHPLGYHVRNYALTIVALALLHRVLLRLVPSRPARVLAVLLFAASKVHLTTIGYLMIFDSILMLTLFLAALLCTLRWCQTRSQVDRALALGFATLCAFTKDYGVVALVVLLAVVAERAFADSPATRRRTLVGWIAPLAIVAALRVGLRWAVVGPMPWGNPIYAPHFSLAEVGRKSLVFLSALTNTSFGWHDKTGASGLGSLVARLASGTFADRADAVDAGVGAVLLALLAAGVVGARRRWRAFLVPTVWMAAFFAPPLFVRNLQVYYAYEPLAGAAVLLGVAWSGTHRRGRTVAALAVAAIAVGGFASNRFATYDWQYAAAAAGTIRQPVLVAQRQAPMRSLSFVTDDVVFWRWVLTADDNAPMLEFLLQRPGLPVRVFDRNVLRAPLPPLDSAHVVLDADAGFAPVAVPRR